MIAVITTLHKKEDAIRIGKGLLNKKLIACYNMWSIESAYWWKGEILEGPETMMLMKTEAKYFSAISEYLKKESGYEVPDIFSLNSSNIDSSFANWIKQETN